MRRASRVQGSTRTFFSFISASVAVPTSITATPLASFARRYRSFSLSVRPSEDSSGVYVWGFTKDSSQGGKVRIQSFRLRISIGNGRAHSGSRFFLPCKPCVYAGLVKLVPEWAFALGNSVHGGLGSRPKAIGVGNQCGEESL